MVKSSVLLMSILSLGLTLGSTVEAVKSKVVGPMDQFVVVEKTAKRAHPGENKESDVPQTGPTSSKKKTTKSKRPRIILTLKTEETTSDSLLDEEQLMYVLGMTGNLGGLSPFQKAYFLKKKPSVVK